MTEKYFVASCCSGVMASSSLFHAWNFSPRENRLGFFIIYERRDLDHSNTHQKQTRRARTDSRVLYLTLRHDRDVFLLFKFRLITMKLAAASGRQSSRPGRCKFVQNWGKLYNVFVFVGNLRPRPSEESENWWVHVPKHRSLRRCPRVRSALAPVLLFCCCLFVLHL